MSLRSSATRAQRLSRNSYDWLRDVHDQLACHGIRLITFLVGQPQLLAQKAGFLSAV